MQYLVLHLLLKLLLEPADPLLQALDVSGEERDGGAATVLGGRLPVPPSTPGQVHQLVSINSTAAGTRGETGGTHSMYCWLQGGEGAESGSELNLWLRLEQRGEGRGLLPPPNSWKRAPPPPSPASPVGLLAGS